MINLSVHAYVNCFLCVFEEPRMHHHTIVLMKWKACMYTHIQHCIATLHTK